MWTWKGLKPFYYGTQDTIMLTAKWPMKIMVTIQSRGDFSGAEKYSAQDLKWASGRAHAY